MYLARPAGGVKRRNGTWLDVPEVRRSVSAGEINRELTVLTRMFSLAIEAGKLHHKPHFAMLREDKRLLNTSVFRHCGHGRVLPSAGCRNVFIISRAVEYMPKFESKFIG